MEAILNLFSSEYVLEIPVSNYNTKDYLNTSNIYIVYIFFVVVDDISVFAKAAVVAILKQTGLKKNNYR